MAVTTSTEFPHPLLRRRVSANRLKNIYLQGESQARGMGKHQSKLIQKVSSQRPTIVDRLAARSITAQSLQILVHQHFGYRIHFEWTGSSDNFSSRFMERRFLMSSDTQTFCIELCKRGLEGLCTFVYENYHTVIPARSPRCLREPYYPTQKYRQKPRWWIKSLEDMATDNCCECNISSETLPDWSQKQMYSRSVSK
jgi:hypothetical protein